MLLTRFYSSNKSLSVPLVTHALWHPLLLMFRNDGCNVVGTWRPGTRTCVTRSRWMTSDWLSKPTATLKSTIPHHLVGAPCCGRGEDIHEQTALCIGAACARRNDLQRSICQPATDRSNGKCNVCYLPGTFASLITVISSVYVIIGTNTDGNWLFIEKKEFINRYNV